MISLGEKQKIIIILIGVIMVLFGGIWAMIYGSSPTTATVAIIGVVLILLGKFAK